jgi:hypothetical protein
VTQDTVSVSDALHESASIVMTPPTAIPGPSRTPSPAAASQETSIQRGRSPERTRSRRRMPTATPRRRRSQSFRCWQSRPLRLSAWPPDSP